MSKISLAVEAVSDLISELEDIGELLVQCEGDPDYMEEALAELENQTETIKTIYVQLGVGAGVGE